MMLFYVPSDCRLHLQLRSRLQQFEARLKRAGTGGVCSTDALLHPGELLPQMWHLSMHVTIETMFNTQMLTLYIAVRLNESVLLQWTDSNLVGF